MLMLGILSVVVVLMYMGLAVRWAHRALVSPIHTPEEIQEERHFCWMSIEAEFMATMFAFLARAAFELAT